jgi:hypothetical protein
MTFFGRGARKTSGPEDEVGLLSRRSPEAAWIYPHPNPSPIEGEGLVAVASLP